MKQQECKFTAENKKRITDLIEIYHPHRKHIQLKGIIGVLSLVVLLLSVIIFKYTSLNQPDNADKIVYQAQQLEENGQFDMANQMF